MLTNIGSVGLCAPANDHTHHWQKQQIVIDIDSDVDVVRPDNERGLVTSEGTSDSCAEH